MSFEEFFNTISRWIGPGPLRFNLGDLARLNPSRFYVENVRSVLNVSHSSARTICDTAVRQGVFIEGIEVICPDGSVAASVDRIEDLPSFVHCYTDDGTGFATEQEIAVAALKKGRYFRLAQP